MIIGILGGTGKEGSGLAVRLAHQGHRVVLGSRDPARAQTRARELDENARRIEGATNEGAATSADVVIIAVPFAGQRPLLTELAAALASKIVLDTVVPLDFQARHAYAPPAEGSAAEEAQAILPSSKVVAGLHQIAASELASLDHAIEADGLFCGDDASAKQVVADLIRGLGIRPVDAGGLKNASLLEALTPLLIAINKRHKVKSAGIRITGL